MRKKPSKSLKPEGNCSAFSVYCPCPNREREIFPPLWAQILDHFLYGVREFSKSKAYRRFSPARLFRFVFLSLLGNFVHFFQCLFRSRLLMANMFPPHKKTSQNCKARNDRPFPVWGNWSLVPLVHPVDFLLGTIWHPIKGRIATQINWQHYEKRLRPPPCRPSWLSFAVSPPCPWPGLQRWERAS